ncbi:MAG: arginine repressor [Clostridia bacterium]|nr:arginine repressor [Clostridia bacterium]MBR3976071.1 arginine repressor [Clostridia bacterium]
MKKNRQNLIAQLIEQNQISTQEELLEMLLNAGVNVTQATVSRDIKEMRIVKHPASSGEYKYCMPSAAGEENASKYMSILVGAAVSTDVAMNTVVVKCHAGTAQAACAALDSLDLEDVAGTLAGDDTIFILCYSVETAAVTKKKLDVIFGF